MQKVTSRKGRVSRNQRGFRVLTAAEVTSRKGRVSRNPLALSNQVPVPRHVPQGACE